MKGQAPSKLISCGQDFVWFGHLEESFSHKEVQFNNVCPPVKTTVVAFLLKTLLKHLAG